MDKREFFLRGTWKKGLKVTLTVHKTLERLICCCGKRGLRRDSEWWDGGGGGGVVAGGMGSGVV